MSAVAADIVTVLIESPLGMLTARANHIGVTALEFPREGGPGTPDVSEAGSMCPARGHLDVLRAELDAYFAGMRTPFTVALSPEGTPFQLEVWHALLAIPFGETRSYTQVAHAIGRPGSVRAVANANGDNPIAILIPCHRVIGADGSLTGYGGGLWRKERLLSLEGSRPALLG
jgi:O-6-methylguanine DNA methyltransferase